MNLSDSDELMLLRAQVDYLLEKFAENPSAGERPVNWVALDSDSAAEQWASLTAWVDQLRDRYQLTEAIPACWYAHPAQLEELSALRTAWTGAYLDPQAHASDGASWHDQLDRTLHRIREWDRNGCADGTHRPDLPVDDDTNQVDRERHIHQDLAERDHTH